MSDVVSTTRSALMRAIVPTRALGALAGLALALAAPAAASASEPVVVCGGGTCSATYEATGGPQQFTVPANVSSLSLDVSGAGGGGGYAVAGGNGARLAATFPVAPGSTLVLVVGRRGEYTSGGYGGGGDGGFGFEQAAGGGGGSFVFSEGNLMIAAAGGGGAGATAPGGPGAWNGVNGGVSAEEPMVWEPEIGHGGTQGAGGAGGYGAGNGAGPTTTSAIEGRGGHGSEAGLGGGGGGGGGYYGGGGGGAGGDGPFSNGGGGGGSDFISAAAEDATFDNGGGGQGGPGALFGGWMGVDGSIVVSWRQVATTVSLKAASNRVPAGGHDLLTATVAPAPPSGTVTFADGEAPIEGCAEVPVEAGTGVATCAVGYAASGSHAITAAYSGSEDHMLLGSTATAPVSVYVEPEPAEAPQEGKTVTNTVTNTVTKTVVVAGPPSDPPPAQAPLLVTRAAQAVLDARTLSLKVRCGTGGCKVRPNVWITAGARSWQLPTTVAAGTPGYVSLVVTVPRAARRELRALLLARPHLHPAVDVLLGEAAAKPGEQLTSMGRLAVRTLPGLR